MWGKTVNTYHILNGDSLLYSLDKILSNDTIIVARECLIDGPVESNNLHKFWEKRADYIYIAFEEKPEAYEIKVKQEFERIQLIPSGSRVFLWFENDLFCQSNFWFCIWMLKNVDVDLYWVKPGPLTKEDYWMGFGAMNANALQNALKKATYLEDQDKTFILKTWDAYQKENYAYFKNTMPPPNLSSIDEAIKAHWDRRPDTGELTRPLKSIQQISNALEKPSFKEIFSAFIKKEGVYGYGDAQVMNMVKELKIDLSNS